jgi:hypothetical protein
VQIHNIFRIRFSIFPSKGKARGDLRAVGCWLLAISY